MSISANIQYLKGVRAKYESVDTFVLITRIVAANQSFILDLNRSQLNDYGIKNTGDAVRPGYKNLTINLKKQKGQRIDHVTLKDEGDFYNSFRIEFTQSGFFIKALDVKTKSLIAKYGREILGLTEPNIEKFLKFAYPKMLTMLKEFTR